jgi:hypothetical protein
VVILPESITPTCTVPKSEWRVKKPLSASHCQASKARICA